VIGKPTVDVVCLGEALIDLVPASLDGRIDADTLVKAAGGAPANVAAGLARLGVTAAFMGTVGDDGLGSFIAEKLGVFGVSTAALRFTRAAPTALAVVTLAADGERDFVFYGHPAAHTTFAPGDIDEAMLAGAKILHIGSISLIEDPLRAATLRAIDLAHRHDVLVSFDPNLRLSLWPDAEAARSSIRLALSLADIVKIGEEEVAFLAGGCDAVEAARALWHPRLRLMAVTRGARGCVWLNAETDGADPGFEVEAVDTTGAGDAFTAALLAGLLAEPDIASDPVRLAHAIRFANAAGALATTRRGAMPALPDHAAIARFLAERTSSGRATRH
jgi:fructokinase